MKLVIEPIFEADFEDSSYGFRPLRSAHDAVKEIKKKLSEGKAEVYDADLSAYFDTIPHNELMILIGRAVNKTSEIFRKFVVEIIRYADDFVLMGRKIPDEVINYLKVILERMKLKVNEEKSRMLNGYKESFDFLGFTFRYSRGFLYQNNKKYWNIEPSANHRRNCTVKA